MDDDWGNYFAVIHVQNHMRTVSEEVDDDDQCSGMYQVIHLCAIVTTQESILLPKLKRKFEEIKITKMMARLKEFSGNY